MIENRVNNDQRSNQLLECNDEETEHRSGRAQQSAQPLDIVPDNGPESDGDASDLWSEICKIDEERFLTLKHEIEFVYRGVGIVYQGTYECPPDQILVELWEEIFCSLTYWGWMKWVLRKKDRVGVIAAKAESNVDEVVKCSICACVAEVFIPYYVLQSPTACCRNAGMSYEVGAPVNIRNEFDEY